MICTTASGPAVVVRNRGVAAVGSRPLACVGSVRARPTAQPIPTVFGEFKAAENPIHARLVFQCQPSPLDWHLQEVLTGPLTMPSLAALSPPPRQPQALLVPLLLTSPIWGLCCQRWGWPAWVLLHLGTIWEW